MATDTQSYFDAVNDVLAAFAQILLEDLREQAAKKKLNKSGDLISQMHVRVVKITETSPGEIVFAMPKQGKIRDIKSIKYSNKQPPIDQLVDYIKRIGLGSFKFVPGYYGSSAIPSQDDAARRIAWGIAKSRLKGNNLRGKPWFLSRFKGKLNDQLIDQLVESTGQASLQLVFDDLQDAFDGK